ncbi:hypothetical protein [Microbacterium luticocti]|uniref:hypothetical protein n=1 Tax=Microbacterium luticocti TaxID=451764 RepID=UPI0012EC8160|nr:hypothetical protein [Microbacterium luticocti]
MATAVLVLAVLTGCTPQPPQPKSSPTPSPRFTSEADAYKAAEDTYRVYVDAFNRLDPSKPATLEEIYRLETGDALAADKKALSQDHADGVRISGESHITVMEPASVTLSPLVVKLSVCLDVSEIEVFDADGNSLVDPDRPDVHSTTVAIEESPASPTGLAVRGIGAREGDPQC